MSAYKDVAIAPHRRLAQALAQLLSEQRPLAPFDEIVIDALVLGLLTLHEVPSIADMRACMELEPERLLIASIEAHSERVLGTAEFHRARRFHLGFGRANRSATRRCVYYIALYRDRVQPRAPQGSLDPLVNIIERNRSRVDEIRGELATRLGPLEFLDGIDAPRERAWASPATAASAVA